MKSSGGTLAFFFLVNHAIDVSHAIVAVAYCDFVLLDAH
jgi:hypothetical protein